MATPEPPSITIRGARVHNLQGVDCDIPRGSLTVITGPSGSGKSSLAFDTLYAEGQRRYVETLTPHARQFLDQLPKPDVDAISGLPPAVAIEQRTMAGHPRSTVGTATEIYDLLRTLYALIGQPHCPLCDTRVAGMAPGPLAERLTQRYPGRAVVVLAPVVRGRRGAFRREWTDLASRGFRRARVDGQMLLTTEKLDLEARQPHRIEAIVDRIIIKPEATARLRSALEKAFDSADDLALLIIESLGERLVSRRMACPSCETDLPELTPRAFSFNSPLGACPVCEGLGRRWSVDPERVVRADRSIRDGALSPWQTLDPATSRSNLVALSERLGFSLETRWSELPASVRKTLLRGDKSGFVGLVPCIERSLEEHLRLRRPGGSRPRAVCDTLGFEELRAVVTQRSCPKCHGKRLRPESLAVRVEGRSIADLASLTVDRFDETLGTLVPEGRHRATAERIVADIRTRTQHLRSLGLGHLDLDRPTTSLSAGEAHRLRLATQLASRMRGLVYVLDEPTAGLHPRDHERLLETLEKVRDQGNTLVLVEHEATVIRAADWLVELGEGAGKHGGRVLFTGPPSALDGTLTGRFLRGELSPPSRDRRTPAGELRLRGARGHNLKNLDVRIPLGVLTVVTGVSGSGKSTLVEETLYRALARRLHDSRLEPGPYDEIVGDDAIDKVIAIDQAPIGRTPRSNPASYTGALASIREIMSLLPESCARGYRPGRFSFNIKGGRCESCEGEGVRTLAMQFLPHAFVVCESCAGQRYNRETLEIRYRGRNIAEILALSVADALPIFSHHPRLRRILSTLTDVGLGYIALGQNAATLSGGEAQRIKLARELSRRDTGKTLYILDEPTTGLHADDTRRLLDVLFRLLSAGNTILLVEHNLDVIRVADHVIDLGPGAGADGGRLVAQGTPERLAKHSRSATGQYLARPADHTACGQAATPSGANCAPLATLDSGCLRPDPLAPGVSIAEQP